MPEPSSDPIDAAAPAVDWRARRGWVLLFALIAAFEAWALRDGRRATLSETLWDCVRWSPWRLLFLPAWCWLTWHFCLRITPVIGRWDACALALGLAWAVVELAVHARL